jgi:uracil-DNA glycosylase
LTLKSAIFSKTSSLINSEVNLCNWTPEAWPVAADWQPVIHRFLRSLGQFMRARLAEGAIIYPSQPFLALALTPLASVKVVILGQDPYHGSGQAEGLAFSVAPGIRPPPSLRNIYKEIARDPAVQNHGADVTNGSLIRWARQGVLLLNTCLTVEDGSPASHAKQGWEALTDGIIRTIWEKQPSVVFMLWGAHAQAKQQLFEPRETREPQSVAKKRHLVLTANHPSPLSALRPPAPFIGCGHFGDANTFLLQRGLRPIDW